MKKLKAGSGVLIVNFNEWVNGNIFANASEMVSSVALESWPDGTTTADLVALKHNLAAELSLAAASVFQRSLDSIRQRHHAQHEPQPTE